MSPSRGQRYAPSGWRDEDEAYRAGSSSSSSYTAPSQRGHEYGHTTQSYYQDYGQYRGNTTYNPQPAPGYDTWARDEHRSTAYADYRAAEYQAYLGTYGHMRGHRQEHGQQGYAYPQEATSWSDYDNYRRYPSAYPASSYSGYSEYKAPTSDYMPTNDRNYDSNNGSYSDYRRTDHQHSREMHVRRSASPPSGHAAQTRGYASQARPQLTKPFLFPSSSPPKTSSSPPPRRTEPTEEYLSISRQPSTPIADPAHARKLVVLDLNGSLLLRAPHQRRAQVPLYGGRTDSMYAQDPPQLRPVRRVHRRPYLAAFTAYILHERTKTWLDVMVWSSAQPHSVDDMVGRCFGERRSELRAVWARDTLGLSGDDYHKKSLTVKDLAKPWAELPIEGSSTLETTTSGSSEPQAEPRSTPTTEASGPQRHSALTTLLVDDSPLKAMLQPWNHLCIKEYVDKMRKADLAVAEWETARVRMDETSREFALIMNESVDNPILVEKEEKKHAAAADEATLAPNSEHQADAPTTQVGELPPALNQDGAKTTEGEKVEEDDESGEPVKRVIHEVVMVDGEMKNTEEVVHKVFHEVVMIRGELVAPLDNDADDEPNATQAPIIPNQKRKLKKLAKRMRERKEREKKERAAFESLHQHQEELVAARSNDLPVAAAEGAPAEAGKSTPAPAPVPTPAHVPAPVEEKVSAPAPRYDETLLAVVGILDHVKHESNVAGWMRSGGLVQIALASSTEASKEVSADDLLAPQVEVEAHAGTKHSPPSRGESPSELSLPTKRRRVDRGAEAEAETATQKSEADEVVPPSSPATEPPASQTLPSSPISEIQALTGVPLSSSPPHSPTHAQTPMTADTSGQASSHPSTTAAPTSNLWFENPAVLLYWANRGRNALNDLGIAINSGVRDDHR